MSVQTRTDTGRATGPTAGLPAVLHPFAKPAEPTEGFLQIVRGRGAEVFDSEGKAYFDALASLWYCNIGHGREEIAEAVARQVRTLEAFHLFDRYTNPPVEELSEKLSDMAPMPGARVFYTSSGSEAVETALKLARIAHHLSGRPERTVVVSRRPSYHGVTYGAMTATGIPANRDGFGPLVQDMEQVPYDDLDALDTLLADIGDRVAAVIAEPIVGAAGVYPPPDGYLKGLRERCDRVGAYLIVDEVICAFGRLSTWWASQYYGVSPDLVVFAKGITSGYIPLGGVLVGQAVGGALASDPSFVLRHGNTYSGHPTAAAAALENLSIMEREELLSGAPRIAKVLGKGLSELVDGESVLEVRGEQGVWALQLGEGFDGAAMREELLRLGVIARPIGTSIMAYCPPLVATEAQLESCVERTSTALSSLRATRGH